MTLGIHDFSGTFWGRWHASSGDALSAARDGSIHDVNRFAAQYEYFAVCIDSPKSFRRDQYPDYKGNRPKKPQGAIEAYRHCVDILKKQGHHVFEAEGYEADDLMATLVRWVGGEMPVVLITGDKDMLQLISPEVSILKPQTNEVRDMAWLQSKAGIFPQDVCDWLALQGDSSDNLPGVTKCGPKSATWLIQEFGSLEDIIKATLEAETILQGNERERELAKEQARKPELAAHRFGTKNSLAKNLVAAVRRDSPTLEEVRDLIKLRDDAPIDCASVMNDIKPERKESIPMPEESTPEAEFEEPQPSQPEAKIEATANAQEVVAAVNEAASKMTHQGPEMPATQPTSALVRVPTEWSKMLEPKGIKMAKWISETFAASGLFRKKYSSSEQILAIIMAGRERGMGVYSSLQAGHIIQGEPRWSAQTIIGMVKAHPSCIYFQLLEEGIHPQDGHFAIYETNRQNYIQPVRMRHCVAQAELAGLTRPSRNGEPSNWVRIPDDMCRKQAGVKLARSEYPDVVGGMYAPEETYVHYAVDAA